MVLPLAGLDPALPLAGLDPALPGAGLGRVQGRRP